LLLDLFVEAQSNRIKNFPFFSKLHGTDLKKLP